MSGFEGSYMGDGARISERAIMECKICWYVYDPSRGDETRQVEAGTPFFALPEDWSCPECDGEASMFLVKDDPGSDIAAQAEYLRTRTNALVADFREIFNAKMKDVPIINQALHVEAVGFQEYKGRFLGVLISPWFMNLVLLPAINEDWSELRVGEKEHIGFPSGDYEFMHNVRELVGGYKTCSLFSPMADFTSQLQAKEVAEAVMSEIFNEKNVAPTDRGADIRAEREEELARKEEARITASQPSADENAGKAQNGVLDKAQEAGGDDPPPPAPPAPTRRALLGGKLSEPPSHQEAQGGD